MTRGWRRAQPCGLDVIKAQQYKQLRCAPAKPASTALSIGERVSGSGAVISRSVTGEGSFAVSSEPVESQDAASKARSNSNGFGFEESAIAFRLSSALLPTVTREQVTPHPSCDV
jgi:hypothetical protein